MLNADRPGDAAVIVARVAENVRNMRNRNGLSLSELATRAGVSKSTLSQLESGSANPSIETLWAIASALGVPFAQILEPREPEVRVVRRGEGIRIDAEDATFHARLLGSRSGRGAFEVYVLSCEPGTAHVARPHIKGAIEHLYMLEGRLLVGPIDAAVEIEEGDLASFAADGEHRYEALTPGTRAVLIMDYS